MTKFRSFFCKNAPVEYIGVYSDTNEPQTHGGFQKPFNVNISLLVCNMNEFCNSKNTP